jgi:hypothetical protein
VADAVTLGADGSLVTAASLPLVEAAEAARSLGRYLPVDAPSERWTVGDAAGRPFVGPRTRAYGPAAGRVLELHDPAGGRARSADEAAVVVWRTAGEPPAARTLFGRFGGESALAAAVARLLATPPPALVALDVVDAATARWLGGEGAGAGWVLLARLEGGAEAVALGDRACWQALEGAGGRPWVFERARGRAWRWSPVHPPDAGAQVVRLAGEPASVPALLAPLVEAGGPGTRARGHLTAGVLYGYLAAGEPERLSWLRRAVRGLGASLEAVPMPI